MRFTLEKVHYMPKDLLPEVLYFSDEFSTCAHLCPCGCNSKIRTPIGPTEWQLTQTKKGPTLYPSIGNWQLDCRSHYWIRNGNVHWAPQWSEKEIIKGRSSEQQRRENFYEDNKSIITHAWHWLKSLF